MSADRKHTHTTVDGRNSSTMTTKEDYEKVMAGVESTVSAVLRGEHGRGKRGEEDVNAIKTYVKELEKEKMPKGFRVIREERKKVFIETLDVVQHELPRSKVGADACAEITEYVDWINSVVSSISEDLAD